MDFATQELSAEWQAIGEGLALLGPARSMICKSIGLHARDLDRAWLFRLADDAAWTEVACEVALEADFALSASSADAARLAEKPEEVVAMVLSGALEIVGDFRVVQQLAGLLGVGGNLLAVRSAPASGKVR